MTPNPMQRLIETASALGAARLAESLGLTAGELSQRQALRTYGKWFADAVKAGRIQPARIEDDPPRGQDGRGKACDDDRRRDDVDEGSAFHGL